MKPKDATARHKVPHDLYFTDACDFGSFISIKEIRHRELEPVWRTFQLNIESVRIMALLPQAVVSAAVEHLLPLTQAVFNVLGKPVMDDDELTPNQRRIVGEYSRIEKTFFNRKRKVRDVLVHDLVIYNKHNLVNSPLTKGGFFAILEALVIGTWAAFDALTTDLCIAAVNASPGVLSKFCQKQITLENLLSAGEDQNWNGRMGELLKVFVRFDSFKGTKEAYERLFGAKSPIYRAISSQDAWVACLIRNQITHDGGIATEKFVAQAREKKADPWKKVRVDERLPLDGRNVAALAEGVVVCANSLIRAVDDWLDSPEAQSPKPRGQDQ